jgi:hypothetical protein
MYVRVGINKTEPEMHFLSGSRNEVRFLCKKCLLSLGGGRVARWRTFKQKDDILSNKRMLYFQTKGCYIFKQKDVFFQTKLWYIFKQKIWVHFGGPWNEKMLMKFVHIWNILWSFLWSFCILCGHLQYFCGHFVYFVVILYILSSFAIFCGHFLPFWYVVGTKKIWQPCSPVAPIPPKGQKPVLGSSEAAETAKKCIEMVRRRIFSTLQNDLAYR